MGYCHYKCYDEIPDAKITAVCDVRETFAKERIKAHCIERHESEELAPRVYGDIDALLVAESIDAVDICTPSYMHADMVVKCLKAGLHVLCEKPMALNTADTERILQTVKETQKKFMVAHVVRFMSPYGYLKQIVESNKYGKPLRLDFKRLSSIPRWSWNDWMRNENLSGGVGFDLSVHDLDFVSSLLGTSYQSGYSLVHPITNNSSYIHTTLVYQNTTVTCEASWYNADVPFQADFLAVFENGYVQFQGGKLDDNGEQIQTDTRNEKKDLGINVSSDNAYTNEIAYFVHCVINDLPIEYITPENSAEIVKTVETLLKTSRTV